MALGEQAGAIFQRRECWSLEQGSDLDRIGWGLGVEETASSGEGTPWARAEAGECIGCAARVTAWGDPFLCKVRRCSGKKKERGAEIMGQGQIVRELLYFSKKSEFILHVLMNHWRFGS